MRKQPSAPGLMLAKRSTVIMATSTGSSGSSNNSNSNNKQAAPPTSPRGRDPDGFILTSEADDSGSSLVANSSSLLYSEMYVPSDDTIWAADHEHEEGEEKQEAVDRAVAEALQQQFDESLSTDDIGPGNDGGGAAIQEVSSSALAALASIDDGNNNDVADLNMSKIDAAVAEALQRQFDQSFMMRRQRESEEGMRSTSTGKALYFVQQIVANQSRMLAQCLAHRFDGDDALHPAHMFRLVNVDDMVFLAERIFALQEQYAQQGKDATVDVGYHYTHSANLAGIRADGLLTNAERNAHMIRSNGQNGSIFGDGIYTANNPFSYHNFGGGDIGLLVCRLKGAVEISHNELDIQNSGHSHTEADTVLGRPQQTDEVCVLRSSQQCVAVVQYNSGAVQLQNDHNLGNKLVYEYHRGIQAIVDECFNSSDGTGTVHTPVQSYLPSQVTIRTLLTGMAALRKTVTTFSKSMCEILLYSAPAAAKKGEVDGTYLVDPKTNPGSLVMFYNDIQKEKEEKSLYQPWTYNVTYLPQKFEFACGTLFYLAFSKKNTEGGGGGGGSIPLAWPDIFDNETILKRIRECAEKHCKQCSKCRKATGKSKITIGGMPSGTMRVDRVPEVICAGYPKGTLIVSYKFEKGTRALYHSENPGGAYGSTFRMSFVPDTPEGRQLVKRLKWAFTRGLTFTIGTSQTTGLSSSIIWDTIPHKTTLDPGGFGFPDETYFERTNAELDKLSVPPASAL